MTSALLSGVRFAVLMGGTAAEREISLQSGENVALALEASDCSVARIDPAVPQWTQQLSDIDFVFNLLHGPGGEDGVVQGLFESMKLPYSGSGVLGSALTMDKVRTKELWLGMGLPTPEFSLLTADTDWSGLINQGGTFFVKPALEGSSIGMSKASTPDQLKAAWERARVYGGAIIAEQFVAGAEYTVTILGDRALPAIRIEPASEFYDFDAKYLSDATGFFCPSGLSVGEEAELGELALRAFSAVDAAVWGRVDIMRDASGSWQLLEVNTIPGMTSHSLVPMAAKAVSMTLIDLVAEIYRLSLEVRHAS
ncbi:D-alanine--D-alanine ligase [Luminiphilus sp. nBUS_07]|uniref:D-alanine--D-alanine ligase n=1 Tax=Luminiphilus sp. nBUS_07 TaxID=3395314 RepID=UPI003EC03AE2